MQRFLRSLVPAMLACAALAAGSYAADDQAKAAGKPATDPAADATAQMMALSQPGKMHEALKGMEGTWKATVKMWQGPGEPQVSEGVTVNTMIMGGRYLEGRFEGKMNDLPFHGCSVMGYDNQKKEYWSTWFDDMSTSVMLNTGSASADGKSFVLTGSMDGPDGKPSKLTCTTRLVDADTHVFTMAARMGEQEMTMMEIIYTRKK